MNHIDLLTITIERRRIGIAAYAGLRLDYVQVRELAAAEDEAARSTQRFITWAISIFKPPVVALEAPPAVRARRRLLLHAIVRGTLAGSNAQIIDVSSGQLKAVLAEPSLRTRKNAHAVAAHLWPRLHRFRHQPAAHAAALIGLHVQMSDLLSSN
jgi:hypothetical protein